MDRNSISAYAHLNQALFIVRLQLFIGSKFNILKSANQASVIEISVILVNLVNSGRRNTIVTCINFPEYPVAFELLNKKLKLYTAISLSKRLTEP